MRTQISIFQFGHIEEMSRRRSKSSPTPAKASRLLNIPPLYWKHCQRHNEPRILSPKLELSLKDETDANSNLAL